MGSANHRIMLSEQIAEILGTRDRSPGARNRNGNGARLSARKSIACGSMMLLAINPGQVGAVGLGDIHLKSRLGQPLEAVVPVTLREGESLPKNCVQPAPRSQALGAPPNIRVNWPASAGPGTYNVRISTANPLHEPMYELSLMIKCHGTPLLVRQYVLMLDLPGMPVAAAAPAPETNSTRSAAVSRRADPVRDAAPVARRVAADPARALPPRTDSIPAGSEYRVTSRDTLSTIARRVEGRLRDTTWQVSDQIFADNPNAFIRNDPNMIKLGSLIRVPGEDVLTAMTPGSARTSAPAPAVRQQPVASPATGPDPATLPPRTPAALASRNEAATARPMPETVTEPASTPVTEPVPPEADVIVATATDAAPPVTTPEPATDTGPDFSSEFSPFADERPTETVVSAPAVMEEIATIPVVTTPVEPADSGPSSSLLTILIGLLAAAGLGLLFLRDRLVAALGALWRRKPVAAARVGRPRNAAVKTGTFNVSAAAAAFERSAGKLDDQPPLTISGPAEQTYIVETAVAETTIQENVESLRDAPPESATAEKPPTDQHSDAVDDEDSAELAKLFDNDDAALTNEPTAEMPPRVPEAMEPTAEVPLPDLESTAQMPQHDDDEIFDPTAELPAGAMDDIFDPTGGIDGANTAEIESTLLQAFDEGLENVDPNEMFATSNHSVEDLGGERSMDDIEVTSNDPLEDSLFEEATVETGLGDLPLGDDEDHGLSETLQEALNLLERDYEDEFTASQILERSALEKSLQEDLDHDAPESKGRNAKRKVS